MKKSLIAVLFAAAASLCAEITQFSLLPADWQGKSYNFLEGYPANLVIAFAGPGKQLAANPPTFIMELPEFLELKGIYTRVNWGKQFPLKKESFTENGRRMVRYRVAFPASAVRNLTPVISGWRPGFNCLILPRKGFAGRDATFRVAFEEKGKRTFKQTYRAVLLPEPEMPSAPLKYFKTGITWLRSSSLTDDVPVKTAIRFWQKFDPRPFSTCSWENFSFPAERNALLDRSFTLVTGTFACRNSTVKFPGTNFKDLGFMVNGRVTRPGVPLFVDGSGKTDKGSICPRYLIADPEGLFWGEYFKRGFETRLKLFPSCRDLWFDYEPFVTEGTCDDCLKDFARFAKLDKVPKREEIRSGRPLNLKWRQFQAVRNRIILEKFVAAAKKHFPNHRIHLCTATPSSRYLDSWSAVDSSTVVSKVYAFNPMNYTTGKEYFDTVASEKKRLGRTLDFSWVDPAEEMERFYKRYKPETILQNIIAAAAQNIGGIVFYPSDSLDGRMLSSIAAGFRAVKDAEEILARGKDVTARLSVVPRNVAQVRLEDEKGKTRTLLLPDFGKDLRTVLKEKDGVYVAAILNYSGRELYLQLAVPHFKGKGPANVTDLVSRTGYTGIASDDVRKGFLVKVPVDGVLLLKIGGKAEKTVAEVSRKTVENGLQSVLKQLENGGSSMEPRQQGDASIRWVVNRNTPAIRLGMGEQYLLIDPAGAVIKSWKNGKKTPVGGLSTSLGEVCFNSADNRKKQEYQVTGHELGTDSVRVSFIHTVPKDAGFGEEDPLADLQIVKQITLKKGGIKDGTVEILTTFRNPGPGTKKFNFRFRNIPVSGWTPAVPPYKALLDGKEIECSRFYGKPDAKISWHAVSRLVPHHGSLNSQIEARWYSYSFETPGSAAFYSWTDDKMMTVEPLYEDVVLAPGMEKSFRQIIRFKMK